MNSHETALVTSPLGVGAVVTLLIAVSFWLDRRYRWFSWLGTAILVITGGAVLANIGVIPPSIEMGSSQVNPFYTFAYDYGVPLAIVFILLSTDLRALRGVGKPALIAFVLASIGTLAGTVVGAWLLADAIGPEMWKLGGQFAASYIGGGVNYAAVGQAVHTTGSLYAAGAAADNIMTNLWMVATAVIPTLLARFYPSIRNRQGTDTAPVANGFMSGGPTTVSIHEMAYLTAVALTLVAVSQWITPIVARWVGFEIPTVIYYTTFALLLSWLTPINRWGGGEELGNLMLHFFFATMGAGTILSTLVNKGPAVFLFLTVLVGVHALIVFGLGKWTRIEIETLSIASQATVGGPSTALALAVSQRWTSLVTPGVLLGVLGYAIGTYVGIATARLLQVLL
ncbi:DUF819 family protein [Polycladomyces subterraneus]|uniref:DUF819 family protein n=1 Tax=Polycladomyces subterraneus TaxID=1016997 RepID=A0ABT8ILX7_9BACL|nr:DUF819 family protein [Polycladomyces subterraneus]MDN4593725.1 DUF819 family protein [Polycladomyces subterraneus]